MLDPQPILPPDLVDEVKFVVKHLIDHKKLARSRLIALDRVSRLVEPLGPWPDTPKNRALMLNKVIHDIISDQLSKHKPGSWHLMRWQALSLSFVEHLSREEAAGELGVSPRHLHRVHGEGITLLTQILLCPEGR